MHAITMVHRALSARCPFIHAKQLDCLCEAAQAAAKGHYLSLSELGRELPSASTRHNIKRIDRLLGNTALHAELPALYQALAQQYLTHAAMPLILIDWSDLTPDRHWQLLRASVALSGRSKRAVRPPGVVKVQVASNLGFDRAYRLVGMQVWVNGVGVN